MTHTLYRVQCQFPEEEQGKYLLVMVKELDRRKSEGDEPEPRSERKKK